MKPTREEERLAKRIAVVERENQLMRQGPMPDAGLPGCGDHSCLVNPPKGMGTNGGCRCDEQALRRMVSWQKREIAKLRAEIEERDRRGCKACHDEGPPGCPEHRV